MDLLHKWIFRLESQGENLSGGRRRRPKRDVGVGNCGDGTAGGTEGREGSGESEESEEREGLDDLLGVEGTGGLVEEGRAGTGADITGKKHGFNLSTETVQGLPPRTNTNVFSFFCRTSKGPTYGGVRGRRTASTRTKTLREASSAEGIPILPRCTE